MVATSSYPGNRVRRSTSHVISPPFGCAPRGLCILATGEITLSVQLTKCRQKYPITDCKGRLNFLKRLSVHRKGGGGSACGSRDSAFRGYLSNPPVLTSRGGQCSSRYAPYWNASCYLYFCEMVKRWLLPPAKIVVIQVGNG